MLDLRRERWPGRRASLQAHRQLGAWGSWGKALWHLEGQHRPGSRSLRPTGHPLVQSLRLREPRALYSFCCRCLDSSSRRRARSMPYLRQERWPRRWVSLQDAIRVREKAPGVGGRASVDDPPLTAPPGLAELITPDAHDLIGGRPAFAAVVLAGASFPPLPLEDSLQLVHLYAERGSPKFEAAASDRSLRAPIAYLHHSSQGCYKPSQGALRRPLTGFAERGEVRHGVLASTSLHRSLAIQRPCSVSDPAHALPATCSWWPPPATHGWTSIVERELEAGGPN
jgi:hypothetical protein